MNFGQICNSCRRLLEGLACATSLIVAAGALAQGPAIQTLGNSKKSPFGDKVEFSGKNLNLDALKEAVKSCGPDCRIKMTADRVILDPSGMVIVDPPPFPIPMPNQQCPPGQVLGPHGFCIPVKKP